MTVTRQTSRFSPRGTKYTVFAAIPALADLMVVYESPWRHSYCIKLRPGGLPRRRPVLAGGVVPQVEVAPAGVTWHVVVAVPGEPAQPGVQVPGEASGRVRDGAEVARPCRGS